MKTPKTQSDVLWALEQVAGQSLKPGEFTNRMFMDDCAKSGITMSYNQAKGRLEELIKQGKLTFRQTVVDGKRSNVYSRVK